MLCSLFYFTKEVKTVCAQWNHDWQGDEKKNVNTNLNIYYILYGSMSCNKRYMKVCCLSTKFYKQDKITWITTHLIPRFENIVPACAQRRIINHTVLSVNWWTLGSICVSRYKLSSRMVDNSKPWMNELLFTFSSWSLIDKGGCWTFLQNKLKYTIRLCGLPIQQEDTQCKIYKIQK